MNIEEEKEIDWTESIEKVDKLSWGIEKAKDLKLQKKDIVKRKRSNPTSTRGPGK